MFKHLFDTMNEMLDETAKRYPYANTAERSKLDEQLQVLKAMSDECIEQWLLFEEKMREFYLYKHQYLSVSKANSTAERTENQLTEEQSKEFNKGQGYYKLSMYDEAISSFSHLVKQNPQFMLGRAYLAMGHMRKGNHYEAARHFQFLIKITNNTKLKAISYNIMGCIQYEQRNLDKAVEYFTKAFQYDPSVMQVDD